jgi:uncharacterized protein (TIGR02246 family)
VPTVDFTLRRQANHRGLSLRRGLVAWVCCLVPTTCLVTGCGTAPSAPQSRLGSLAVEPELRMTKTSGAQQRPLRIPDVTTPAKPFRLADMEAALRPMQLAWGIESPDSSTRVQQVAAFDEVPEPGRLSPTEPSSSRVAEIRDMLTSYLRAFNRHDALAAADHWTLVGENVNLDSGEVTRGREAVKNVFAALFALDAEATIDIDVAAIRPLRDDVAVVDGISRVSYADGDVAGSRFSAVVVREADRWMLASVRETAAEVAARPVRPLDELAWLVGAWEDVGEGVTASSQCAWSSGSGFLVRCHVVSLDDYPAKRPAVGDAGIPSLLPAGGLTRRELTEIIGWDPEREAIHSWIFSSDGRFAEGTWSREADGWTIRIEGRGLDRGREATCTLLPDGPDGLAMRCEGDALAGILPPACGFTRTSR